MLFFIFIAKNTNANGILIFDFVNVSYFHLKFYVFKIKSLCRIFIRFCDSFWIMVCRICHLTKHYFKHYNGSLSFVINELVVKVQDSLSRGPVFQITGCLQGRLNHLSFQDCQNEYQNFLTT